jgi:hypothetical protein
MPATRPCRLRFSWPTLVARATWGRPPGCGGRLRQLGPATRLKRKAFAVTGKTANA